MKRTNSLRKIAKLLLLVLTLSVLTLSFVSCDAAVEEILGMVGSMTSGNNGCTHENLKYYPRVEPTCEDNGSVEYYACYDCDAAFFDAEAKRQITMLNSYTGILQKIGGEHVFEGDICIRCRMCRHLEVDGCVCTYCGGEVHNRVLVPHLTPTCDTDGNLVHYACSDCDKIFYTEKGSEIEDPSEVFLKGGHHFFEGLCVSCGACTHEGVVNGLCGECGACRHLSTTNCVCNYCGDDAHKTRTQLQYIEPTCENDGRIACNQCLDCHSYLYISQTGEFVTSPSDMIIPAIGHNYKNGRCENCFDCKHVKLNLEGRCTNCGACPHTNVENGSCIDCDWCPHLNVENCVCVDCSVILHGKRELVLYTAPTCEKDGNFDYYRCEDCGEFCGVPNMFGFEGTFEELAASVIIPAFSEHYYRRGACQICGISENSNGDNLG